MSADMRGKFIYVKDPYEPVPFWYKIRYWIAALFLPELKYLRRNHLEYYTTHQYMLSVHAHYEAQLRQLNKAITRLSKKNKALTQKEKTMFEDKMEQSKDASLKTVEQALAEIKEIVNESPEIASLPLASDGVRIWSLSEVLKEIENGSEIGIKLLNNYRGVK